MRRYSKDELTNHCTKERAMAINLDIMGVSVQYPS